MWGRLGLLVWVPIRTILVTILGTLLYVVVAGFLILTLYSTIYVWLGKIVFSIWNICRVKSKQPPLGRQDPRLAPGLDPTSDPNTMSNSNGRNSNGRTSSGGGGGAASQAGESGAAGSLVYLTQEEVLGAIRESDFAERVEEWGLAEWVAQTCGGGGGPPPAARQNSQLHSLNSNVLTEMNGLGSLRRGQEGVTHDVAVATPATAAAAGAAAAGAVAIPAFRGLRRAGSPVSRRTSKLGPSHVQASKPSEGQMSSEAMDVRPKGGEWGEDFKVRFTLNDWPVLPSLFP